MKKEQKTIAELHQIALNEAFKIHENDYETVITIDKYGKIRRKKGNRRDVEATADMMENAVITLHNHPDAGYTFAAFSGSDVEVLIENPQLQEIMVCGYWHCWTLKRAKNHPKYNAKQIIQDLQAMYDYWYNKTADKISKVPYIEDAKKREKVMISAMYKWHEERHKKYNTALTKYLREKGFIIKKEK